MALSSYAQEVDMAAPYQPEPFATPIVTPNAATLFRRTPYISPSEYNAAPTAVATNNLVVGKGASASLDELGNVIMRASDWVDTICFHLADGTLAASPSTESDYITPKNGVLQIQCNFKPILEIDALSIGPSPNNLQSISQDAANGLSAQGNIITLAPFTGAPWGGPQNFFPPSLSATGKVYCAWTYVNGFPHSSLAADAVEGDTSITVDPSVPGGDTMYGVYAGTQLTLAPGTEVNSGTEVIVVESVNGLTLNLVAPLQYPHTVPTQPSPDTCRVTAIPWTVQQATISLVSCLIKMRGSRAMVLPNAGGSQATKQALMQSGGLQDFEAAVKMLKPFTTVYVRNSSA